MVRVALLEVHEHEHEALALFQTGHRLADDGSDCACVVRNLHAVAKCRRSCEHVARLNRAVGIGIDPASLPRVFEPFFTRLDVSHHSSGTFEYDTRGLEAAYLARGQSRQVQETEAAMEAFEKLEARKFQPGEPIELGASEWAQT